LFDKNCLSYWFPRLAQVYVGYPRTEIVPRPSVSEIREAALRISATGPWFLRTGHISGKHQWKDTCDLRDLSKLQQHIDKLAELSEMADLLGLPSDVWVVRERLPVQPIAYLPLYGDMPLVKEMRAFIRGGKIQCLHPYWPENAIAQGLPPDQRYKAPDLFQKLTPSISEAAMVQITLERVARAFPEQHGWSVDLLGTRFGWYVTDMAVADRSFHYLGCDKQ
jgi:hypothetical protein